MNQIWNGYPVWVWAIACAFLAAGAVQAVFNIARSGGRRKREQAIKALCTHRGMRRVDDTRSPFLPQMLPLVQPRCQYTYAMPDGSVWFSEVGDKGPAVFAVLIFGVSGMNLPYVAVARKGEVEVPLRARGQSVELESIDFTERFEIHADDPRAAVMLIDQGMMQWLLDCDRASFQVTGPFVSAIVKLRDRYSTQPSELELLLRFHDGFAAHVPEIIHGEFAAPDGYAEAASQAIQMVSNVVSGGPNVPA